MPLRKSVEKFENPKSTPIILQHILLQQNHILTEMCYTIIKTPHLFLENVVLQVGWCSVCVKTITMFRLNGKTVKKGFFFLHQSCCWWKNL